MPRMAVLGELVREDEAVEAADATLARSPDHLGVPVVPRLYPPPALEADRKKRKAA